MKKFLTYASAICMLCMQAFAQEPITTPTFLGAWSATTQTIANNAAVGFLNVDFSNHIAASGNVFQVDFTGKYQVEFYVNTLSTGLLDSAPGSYGVAVNGTIQPGTTFAVTTADSASEVAVEGVAIVVVPNDGGIISIINNVGNTVDSDATRINIKRIGKGPNP